ncbi:hypothetical protein Purlil1_11830 [Purpureocillium lilacinum]|uniref:RNase III domain-containing protein n=1 Tax=Purpureocillium lilacinum TaxID=33203 RepID=A0ABR0BJD1_PURLI|nr:hypothetical protein Purlil1_11830 [Purpureocillium lilacinum]
MASIYSIMVARCEEKLDYTFSDKLPCATAINAGPGGVARLLDGHSHLIQKNDRIAILGDIVASERLAQLWLRQRLSKGQWTEIRNGVLSNARLAEVGFRHGFDNCIVPNPGTVNISTAMMATAMEAIMGAVFLDGGGEALDRVMARLGLTHPLLDLVKSTTLHPFQIPNLNVYYDTLTLNSIGPFRECPSVLSVCHRSTYSCPPWRNVARGGMEYVRGVGDCTKRHLGDFATQDLWSYDNPRLQEEHLAAFFQPTVS